MVPVDARLEAGAQVARGDVVVGALDVFVAVGTGARPEQVAARVETGRPRETGVQMKVVGLAVGQAVGQLSRPGGVDRPQLHGRLQPGVRGPALGDQVDVAVDGARAVHQRAWSGAHLQTLDVIQQRQRQQPVGAEVRAHVEVQPIEHDQRLGVVVDGYAAHADDGAGPQVTGQVHAGNAELDGLGQGAAGRVRQLLAIDDVGGARRGFARHLEEAAGRQPDVLQLDQGQRRGVVSRITRGRLGRRRIRSPAPPAAQRERERRHHPDGSLGFIHVGVGVGVGVGVPADDKRAASQVTALLRWPVRCRGHSRWTGRR